MGVLGLTPFLQKTCPEVIRKLPDRLRSFRGKTVVIDGTLITQRLHFAAMPWDHRHVLGWYKIIQELKDSGVHAICVFDGQERNKAKAGETARRKGLRKQDEARGSVEAERLKRLQKLIGVVGEYRSLPSTERERVIVTLKEIVSNTRKSGAFLSSPVIGSKRVPFGIDDIEVSESVDDSGDDSLIMQPIELPAGTVPPLEASPPSEDALATEDEFPYAQSISSADFDISELADGSGRYTSYSSDSSGPTDAELRDILLARIGQSIASSPSFVMSSLASPEDYLDDELRFTLEEELCVPSMTTAVQSDPETHVVNDTSPQPYTPTPHDHLTSNDNELHEQPTDNPDLDSTPHNLIEAYDALPTTQNDIISLMETNRESPTPMNDLEGRMMPEEKTQTQDGIPDGFDQPPLVGEDLAAPEIAPSMQISTGFSSDPEIPVVNDTSPQSFTPTLHDHPPSTYNELHVQPIANADHDNTPQNLMLEAEDALPTTQNDMVSHIHADRDSPVPIDLEGRMMPKEKTQTRDGIADGLSQPPLPGEDLATPEIALSTQTPTDFSSPMDSTLSVGDSATEARDVKSAFVSLYLEYCQSIPKLTSLSSSNSPPSPSSQDPSEAQMEYVMSRQQLQLTVDEGKIWDELVEPKSVSFEAESELPEEGDTVEAALFSLAEKSSLMSQSYERRNNPPTAQTYEESKEIIKAMGVPCVDSVGAYEAEALAASLVINGHADYVASEDTDVLVYEAPLIRNITSRIEPLTVVYGSDIRTVLQLDRASFIDFALLLGTDFSQRIKNVGPQRALKFIREHGTIERVIERERKFSPRVSEKLYLKQVEVARLVFQTLPPVPDPQLLQAKESDPNLVSSILQRYGLHRATTYDWDHATALDGNYFQDDPTSSAL